MSERMSAMREACLNEWRIDTHAHLGDMYPSPRDVAAQSERFAGSWAVMDSRATAEGCRVLYGIDVGAFVRSDVDPAVLAAADTLRARGAWPAVERALDVARIEKQIAFFNYKPKDSRPFVRESGGRIAYLAYIDSALNSDGGFPCPDNPPEGGEWFARTYHGRLEEYFGPLATFDDYLGALDEEIDAWRAHGVVGLKTAIAYTSGLEIGNPTLGEARTAFARKGAMTMADFRVAHDYAFHHILAACLRNSLPVVIHTGYQIWGHADLRQSNPIHLHTILVDKRYRDLTFVLLHGGNPYVGETTYLAGMFDNVVIDFTWIGWLTPSRFRLALAEWLASVPHDRMCFGSDSGTPETICGIDSLMRRAIADVLDACVADRTIDERYALEFVENCYRKTPKRVFGV